MLKEERQQTILSEVELHNRILLTDIAETLDVSIDTIRRDVKELDADNKLRKVHGGAISLGFTTNSTRNNNIYKLESGTLTLAGTEPGSDTKPTSFEGGNSTRVFEFTKVEVQ